MATQDRINELKDAIIAHLNEKGARDWREVKDRFEDISLATFWRYVNWGKDFTDYQRAPADGMTDISSESTAPINKDITEPALWEPQHLNAAFRSLKQAERFCALYADAELARTQSLDDHGKIKNAALFAKSILVRERLLHDELTVMDNLRDIAEMTNFIDTVTATVNDVSPETRQRIVEALMRVRRPPKD